MRFLSKLFTRNNSKTGVYVVKNGRVVKISDRANARDVWFSKYQISADKDIREGYKSLAEKGKLYEVDDKEIWEQYL